MSTWQLVIVTGMGYTTTSSRGTSTFYTAAEGDLEVKWRGTADRVVHNGQNMLPTLLPHTLVLETGDIQLQHLA